MYVDPFVCEIAVTILAEVAILIIAAVFSTKKK